MNDLLPLIHKAAQDMIAEFSKSLIVSLKEVLAKENIDFEELQFKANPSNMPGAMVTVAYWHGEPILEWTSPTVTLRENEIIYQWKIRSPRIQSIIRREE